MDASANPPPLPLQQSKSALTIWSFVLSLLGLLCFSLAGSIPAILCGHRVLSRIRRGDIAANNRGLAVASLIIGYAGAVIHLLVLGAVFVWMSPAGRLMRHPPSHEFVLEVQPRDSNVCPSEEVISQLRAILSSRLQKAGVSFRFIADAPLRLRVQVGVPQETSPVEIQRLIFAMGLLEFRLVHPENGRLVAESYDPEFRAPLGYERMSYTNGSERQAHTCFVSRKEVLTGKYLARARVDYDQLGQPQIALQFNDEGAKKFAVVAAANPERQLAIVLDGELYSAPIIKRELSDNARVTSSIRDAQITGNFSVAEAQQLANILQNPLGETVKIIAVRKLGR